MDHEENSLHVGKMTVADVARWTISQGHCKSSERGGACTGSRYHAAYAAARRLLRSTGIAKIRTAEVSSNGAGGELDTSVILLREQVTYCDFGDQTDRMTVPSNQLNAHLLPNVKLNPEAAKPKTLC